MGAALDRPSRTRMHHAALLACAAGNAPLPQTLALIGLMEERGLSRTSHALNFGLHACMTHRAWRETQQLVAIAREEGIRIPPAEYAKAIKTYGSASPPPPWSATSALLDEAAEADLVLPESALLHTLRAGVAAGVGWDAVRELDRLKFRNKARISSDGLPIAIGAPGLEGLVQGELFCLAAQDGTERDRLRMLIWRLRKAAQAPTPKLFYRALQACAGSDKEGWRNVPMLLELARIERVRLHERAFAAAVEAHAPLSESPSRGAERLCLVTTAETAEQASARAARNAAGLRELAALLGVGTLRPSLAERLQTLCNTSPAVQAHIKHLLSSLRPRSTMHEVAPALKQATEAQARKAARRKRPVARANVAPDADSASIETSVEICDLIGTLARRRAAQVGSCESSDTQSLSEEAPSAPVAIRTMP
mmetsp:Transcript_33516/g.88241  ORF Transcript_33516/g.88241 Transcript_33516/m.88241 type:complete len:424 (-) Transcript_33516:72-1343(-)